MNTLMSKSRKYRIVICALIIMTFMMSAILPCNYSSAATYPYNTLDKRAAVNQKKYNQSESMTAFAISRYQDVYLTDMFETNEKGMTVEQQEYVKAVADEIVAAAAEEKGAELTDYEKIRAFHDWIIEHFYYYKWVNNYSSDCDNPYYLLTTEYNKTGEGKIRSRCNGFSSTLIAFSRAYGMPARSISGHYIPEVRKTANNSKWSKITKLENNHAWTQIYVDRDGDGTKEWIVVDCNADCWNRYNPSSGYIEEGDFYDQSVYEAVRCAYFDVSAKRLAQSHTIISFRSGSKDVKYIGNAFEKKKLKAFLEIKYNGKKNGKKINSSYTADDVGTWVAIDDVKSKGDGYGKLYKLYWPSNANLYGKLDLSGFTALQNFSVTNNKLTSLYLKNCTSLTTVAASQNKLKTIDTRGSKKLTLLSVQGNPATFVAYTFNANRTAIIKTNNAGGTVSVKYNKTSAGKHQHVMTAFAKSGYKFIGWYQGNKKISGKAKMVKTNVKGFTYVAKFKKK